MLRTLRIEFFGCEIRPPHDLEPPTGVRITDFARTGGKAFGSESNIALLLSVPIGITTSLIATWLDRFIENYRAKHVAINGRKTQDKTDRERIIREEVEIGKND